MQNMFPIYSKSDKKSISLKIVTLLLSILFLIATLFLIVHKYRDYPSFCKYILLIGVLLVVLLLFVFLTRLCFNTRLEVTYIGTALILGLSFMLIIPIYCVPDEQAHYWKSYQLSNVMMDVDSDVNHISMRVVDTSLPIKTNYKSVKALNKYYRSINDASIDTSIIPSDYASWAIPDYIYVFPALGISFGRVLRLNGILVFLLGRLGNLVFFVFLTSWAIKKTPVGKLLFFCVALLPMTIQQAASLSYDSPLIASGFVIVAYTLSILNNDEMKIIDWVVLALSISILLPLKSHAYFLLALLPLICLFKPTIAYRKKRLIVVITLIGIVFSLLVYTWDNLLFSVEKMAGADPGITQYYTLQYFFNHPSKVLVLVEGTFRYKFGFYLSSMIGESLGWFNINAPSIMIWIGSGLLVLGSLRRKSTPLLLNRPQRVSFAAVFLLTAIFICSGMLFSWTPINSLSIEGVQGRYFLPILPLALLAAQTPELEIDEKWDNRFILTYSLWLSIFVLCIINRY